MNVYFGKGALRTLDAKMAELRGRGAKIAADKIAKAIEDGNRRDRLAGLDRYGRPLAKLRSKRTGKYAGASGPPLAPFGAASRVVTRFQAAARRTWTFGWRITAGWRDVTSASGIPFLPFHNEGRGRLPVRAIFGISPSMYAGIRPAIAEFKARVAKVKA